MCLVKTFQKLRPRRHIFVGAQVLALEPKVEGRSDRVTVRLLSSNATVTARCSELGEKFEADAARAAAAADKAGRKVGRRAPKARGERYLKGCVLIARLQPC